MASLKNPFHGPITVGKAVAQGNIYLFVGWLCVRISGVLGLAHDVTLLISCVAIRTVSMIGSAREGHRPKDVSFGLADLWFFALLVLIVAIVKANRNPETWPFAVVLGLVVIVLGVVVESRREPIEQAAGDARSRLTDPQVDDVH